MNCEGSNLRPVTLAELQAAETRISGLIGDVIHWIELSDSRKLRGIEQSESVRKRIAEKNQANESCTQNSIQRHGSMVVAK